MEICQDKYNCYVKIRTLLYFTHLTDEISGSKKLRYFPRIIHSSSFRHYTTTFVIILFLYSKLNCAEFYYNRSSQTEYHSINLSVEGCLVGIQ